VFVKKKKRKEKEKRREGESLDKQVMTLDQNKNIHVRRKKTTIK
jgi:hypothetical protein